MKKVKIWVLALMVMMIAGIGLNAINSLSVSQQSSPEVRESDVEWINGTFVINQNTTDPLTGEKGKYGFDSNIIVGQTGTLIVENATIYFLSDIAHPRSLTVYGSLILYNATLTLATSQIQPYYHLNVTINGSQNPSAEVRIVKSDILYDGWFIVASKSVNILIKDTVFDRLNSNTYGPTPDFRDSVVVLENCSFNSLFEHASSGTLYIGNMTDTTGAVATTTSSGTLTHFVSTPDSQYGGYWDKVPIKELQMNVEYSTSSDYDNSSQIRLVYSGAVLLSEPLDVSTNTTTLLLTNDTFSSADLKASDIEAGITNGDIVVEVTEVHYRGTVTISKVELRFLIEKNVDIYGIERFDFNLHHSTIYAKDLYVAADFELEYGTTHNRISLYDDSKLYVLNLSVENTLNKQDSCIYADDAQSQVYIFRYGEVTVTFNGIRLPGLYVNATPYLVDDTLRNTVITETRNFISYMGFGNMSGNTIWGITDSNGVVKLPLMSDIVNQAEWPNSRYVGVYNMWVNKTGENYYVAQIAVDHFPNMQVSNNTLHYNAVLSYYKHVDIGVDMWIRTPSPYLTGNSVDITLNISNSGTEVGDNVRIYVYVNSNLIVEDQIISMAPSSQVSRDYTLPGNVFSADGVYNITAMVRQIWDTNPANNVTIKNIKVGRISVSQWVVDKLINRHTGNITANVYSYFSMPSTTVSLYMDTTLLKTWNALYSGENVLTYTWNVNGTAGDKTLYLYVNSTLIDEYSVHVYRDVDISVDSIAITPPTVYVSEEMDILVNVTNHGMDTPTSTYLLVTVYDPYNRPAQVENITVSVVGSTQYSVAFVPTINGIFTVDVEVKGGEDYNSSNDYLYLPFEVKPTPYSVSPVDEYSFVNGTTVKVDVTVSSMAECTLSVQMYVQALNLTVEPGNIQNPVQIPQNGKIMAEFNIAPEVYQPLLRDHSIYSVMYFIRISSNITQGNSSFGPFYFTLKEKTNFQVVPGSLIIEEDNRVVNNLHVAEGVIVQIKFMVRNTGGIAGNLTYSIMDGNDSIALASVGAIAPGDVYNVTFNYTIYGVGTHNISVMANPQHNISEKMYSDNGATVSVDVIPPAMDIRYSISSKEHGDENKIYAGDHVVVIVTVINMNATESQGKNVYVSGAAVTLRFGSLGTYHATTNSVGVARIEFVAQQPGQFSPTITAEYHGASQSVGGSTRYTILEKPLMETIPWLWVIVGAIALAIGLFFLYGYLSFKKEAKEYMICGNCGHLIPADAERCPYCGAVFEKEKVKCPDCGSWIDEDSKFCPVCGSVFMGTDDPEYDRYMSLKERYDQYLMKYKEEARKYIGEDFSNEEFFKWWKTHPEFISFLEWVKRQEEEIEGETVKCPVCGALNPKGSKICRVCGSPLPTEEEGEAKMTTEEHTVEHETPGEEDSIMAKYREEYEKIKHPGVVSFEEWVRRKEAERAEAEGGEKAAETPKEKKAATAPKPKAAGEKPVEEKIKEGYIKCPVCGALNKPDAKVCAVCGSPLEEKPAEKEKPKSAAPSKPVVKKKVIKKVIPVNKEEEGK